MPGARRATVYFDRNLYRALRLKALETEQSLSDGVNASVRAQLSEDADDAAAACVRAKEPNLRFEDVLKDLKRRGKL